MTELYQAYAVGLIKLGVIMLGDRTAAEDVVQDAFFGLYRNWGRLSDQVNALAYVRASVLNGCRAALRQRIRRDRKLSATPVGTEILAIALSPDGSKLAVGTAPWTDDTTHSKQTLTVYSVATGAVLRTWTTPPGPGNRAIMSGGEGGADPNTGVAWVGNHALAFAVAPQTTGPPPHGLAVPDTSRPDGDLLAGSRPVTAMPTDELPGSPARGLCGAGQRDGQPNYRVDAPAGRRQPAVPGRLVVRGTGTMVDGTPPTGLEETHGYRRVAASG